MEKLESWSRLALAAAQDWAPWFIAVCTQIYASPLFRLACYLLLVLVTIWAIAKIYGGNLQNAEKGPVAIRKHKGATGSVPLDTLVVHRSLIDINMDGVQAKCTFMYVYEGNKSKRQHIPLLTRQMHLNVSASPLSDKVLGIIKANEVPDVASHEVYWPLLDTPDEETPQRAEATPERARDYANQNKVHARWSGDDALQLVSLHSDLLEELKEARDEFITERVGRPRKARAGKWWQRINTRSAARNRPGAVGNYYVRFQFSNDPAFVLSKHPDRDVRMTAWLTVLTSLFAIAMELFPLNDPGTPSAREASQNATPRTRPIRIP